MKSEDRVQIPTLPAKIFKYLEVDKIISKGLNREWKPEFCPSCGSKSLRNEKTYAVRSRIKEKIIRRFLNPVFISKCLACGWKGKIEATET